MKNQNYDMTTTLFHQLNGNDFSTNQMILPKKLNKN